MKNLDPYNQDVEGENVMSPPKQSAHNGNRLASGEIGEASNSLAPGMPNSLIQSGQTLLIGKYSDCKVVIHDGSQFKLKLTQIWIIDEDIVERVIEFGYPREPLIHYLNKNELNNATAAYWLFQMAQQ